MSQKHDQMKEVRAISNPSRGNWFRYWYDTKNNKIWEIRSPHSHTNVIENNPVFFRLNLDQIEITGQDDYEPNLDITQKAGWVRIVLGHNTVFIDAHNVSLSHHFTKTQIFRKFIETHPDTNLLMFIEYRNGGLNLEGKSAIRMFIKTGREPSGLQRFREFMDLREVRNIELFQRDKKIRKGIRRKHSKTLRDLQFALELEISAQNWSDYRQDMDLPPDVYHDIWGRWAQQHESDFDNYLQQTGGESIFDVLESIPPHRAFSDLVDDDGIDISQSSHGFHISIPEKITDRETREEIATAIVDALDEIHTWYDDNLSFLKEEFNYDTLSQVRRSSGLDYEGIRDDIHRKVIAPIFNAHKKKKRVLTQKEQEIEKLIQRSASSKRGAIQRKVIENIKNAPDLRRRVNQKRITHHEAKRIVDEIVDYVIHDLLPPLEKWVTRDYEKYWHEFLSVQEQKWRDQLDYESNYQDIIYEAKSDLESDLSYDWAFEWDDSGAVEMTTGVVSSKDVGTIIEDLKEIASRQYTLRSDHSCHIHIDRGKDYTHFDGVALAILTDDPTITGEREMPSSRYIGKGRVAYLSDWARPVLKRLPSETPYSLGSFMHFLDKGSGINVQTYSTDYRTIEIRYPSATMLNNPESIIAMVQYYISALAVVRNRNIVMRKEKGNWHVVVRSPRHSGGGMYQQVKDLKDLDYEIRELISKYGRELASNVRREYLAAEKHAALTSHEQKMARAKKLSPERYKEFRKRTMK